MTSTEIRVARPRVAFAGPGLQVNGLEAVPEGLWLCDQRDNRSYLVDYASGQVLTSFASPARNASGITVGADSVWVGSNVDPPMIFRHELATGHCTAFLMLEGPGGVHGLQWRPGAASGTLWVSRPGALRIDHIEAETGELLGSFQCAGFSAVEQNERMQVAVAGVKDICATQTGLARHLANPAQCFPQTTPRNHTVLHDEIRRQPANRAESVLAPFPNRHPLR